MISNTIARKIHLNQFEPRTKIARVGGENGIE
jgi:hypothetical protein